MVTPYSRKRAAQPLQRRAPRPVPTVSGAGLSSSDDWRAPWIGMALAMAVCLPIWALVVYALWWT